MSTVAIVGSGVLGGSIAHKLAAKVSVREIRLIDSAVAVAEGTTLDIQQAGAVEQFDTVVVGKGDLRDVMGADVIVLAGPVGEARIEWNEVEGLAALAQVAEFNRRALIICAGSTHCSLVERGVAKTPVRRQQLVGSAPYALTAAIKAIVALELGCSALDISLTVLGCPPDQLVVPWSQASARGVTITELLEPQRLKKLQQRVGLLWPPGPYALSSAAASLCDAILKGTADRGFPCFVVLDGELGVRHRAAAVTVALDETGVVQVLEPVLSVRERTQLETAFRL